MPVVNQHYRDHKVSNLGWHRHSGREWVQISRWHLPKHKLNISTCGGSNCRSISSFGEKGRAAVVIQPVNGREIRESAGVHAALIFNSNVFLTFTTARSFLLYGRMKQMCRVSRLRNHRKCQRFCLNFNCAPVPSRSSVATVFPCLPSGSVNCTTTQFYYSFFLSFCLSTFVFHENKAEDKLIVVSRQNYWFALFQQCCLRSFPSLKIEFFCVQN